MLAVRRDRPGRKRYWVLPGGHVDPDDRDIEAALSREIREEIAGDPEIVSVLYVLEAPDERQYFYLARISSWSFADRTGPEFAEAGRGSYALDKILLTADGLSAIDLQPSQIADLLREAVGSGRDLFTMPDLRSVLAPPS
jgi:ADP-ribose pyrophosphatase YjhB (NUDIX family)